MSHPAIIPVFWCLRRAEEFHMTVVAQPLPISRAEGSFTASITRRHHQMPDRPLNGGEN
jgi:hypothetical protein